MKVTNTVEVFSETVSKALLEYGEAGLMDIIETHPLAELILMLNNLFDVFNGSKNDPHPMRQPYKGMGESGVH